jgi:hypothetical protein
MEEKLNYLCGIFNDSDREVNFTRVVEHGQQ